MTDKNRQPENIRFNAKNVKLVRSFMFLTVLIIFIITENSPFRSVIIIMSILYSCMIVFFVFCGISKQDHILHSSALLIPEIILSSGFLLFINPYWLLPLVSIQAAELVMEKQRLFLIRSFIAIVTIMMFTGFIIRGEIKSSGYSIPSLLAVLILIRLIHLQKNNNNKKYEYMKNLVDNKNKLLSTLTHELRTPLSVIKTSNELIMEERPGPINETQRSLIYSSLENTKRLNALVENILSQVKVEFAWFSMKQQPIDIRNLIRKVALDIKPYLDTKKQKLKYNYPSLMTRTIGDKRWLEQVLLNLIHNGSKNSPDDSTISISVQENEQCIVVSVHDRGSGIKNKEIPQVFNEFYQSSDPSKNLNEGAGLGLTIVRDIIEKHKGEVYISSLPQTGTTVSFTLPLYKGVFSGTNNSDN